MAANSQNLKFRRVIAAPAATVYRAFTHATALRDWLCDAARTEARLGGLVYLGWASGYAATGQFTRLTPAKDLTLTWNGRGDPGETRVSVRLTEREGRTTVVLTHAGLGAGKAWAEARRQSQVGWEGGLENLQSVLETGVDLRTARLPRLGIFIDEFNPAVAAQLAVPVTQGIRLAGTADETGARAAGLQPNDVIVRLNGKKAVDFATLRRALEGLRGGDTVPVEFYRGAVKHRVKMTLSTRPPAPEPPATGAALADLARRNQAQVLAGFEQHLAGVSEAQAEVRPAPDEWNAKELVAHFIACERDLQSWIADMLNDNTVGDSLEFRPNVTPRLAAIVARYPTLPALLAELKAAGDETAALLAALPPEFVARRHMYQRVAGWIMGVVPSHLPDEHAGQLQSTLDAARQALGGA